MRFSYLAVLALLACGPSVGGGDNDGDDDGGTTSGNVTNANGDDEGFTTAVDEGFTTAGDDTTGFPGTTGGNACEMYTPATEIGPPVVITVRHDGTTPVFFDPYGCGGSLTFAITSGAQPIPYLLDSECSPNTCDGFVTASDCFVGCNDCGIPSAGRIEAGATGDATWPGRINTELELLPACVPLGDCPDSCVRPDQAPAGRYEFALTVYRTCTGTCECEPQSPGICTLWNYDEELTDPVVFTATIDYPATTTAEIVITD